MVEEDHQSLELSLTDSVVASNIRNIASDFAEIGLDTITENELLKSIPIVSTVINATNAIVGIRDRLFLRKVAKFLFRLEEIPRHTRQEFVKRMNDQRKRDFGETVILLLDRLDSIRKADMVAKVYGKYIVGEIDREQAQLLCSAIDRVFLPYLDSYLFSNEQPYPTREIVANFVNAGIFSLTAHVDFDLPGTSTSVTSVWRTEDVTIAGMWNDMGYLLKKILKEQMS